MSEEKAVAVKMVDVINQGGCTHITSKGPLGPNCGMSLPEAEANKMLVYRYIVRADSIVKSVGDSSALKDENAALKAKVAELQAKVNEFLGVAKMADLKDLQEKHAPVAAE